MPKSAGIYSSTSAAVGARAAKKVAAVCDVLIQDLPSAAGLRAVKKMQS